MLSMITISDDSVNEILIEVGYPIVTFDELEYTREQFEQYIVLPVMREYFTWFPLIEKNEYSVSSTFSIDFPDTDTFDVLDARINVQSLGGGATTSNPFINEQYIHKTKSAGKWGTNNDYDMDIARIYRRWERSSSVNSVSGKKIDVEVENRKVTGYTNIVGRLTITWAKTNPVFEEIPQTKFEDVIMLCKAQLLRSLGMIRGQQNSDTPVQFDSQLFLDRAEELEEQVKTRWRSYAKPVIKRA